MHSGWSSRNLLDLYVKNGCVPIQDGTGKETWFGLRRTGAIYGYKRRSGSQGHVLSVIRNVGTTKQNSSVLRAWDIEFSYPKPLLLIQYLIQIFTSPDQGDLVLDAFAGSGTTGHAVLAANAEDGSSRRYILVQQPEAAKDLEFGTIADITRERMRRAGKIISAESDKPVDIGFRAYSINDILSDNNNQESQRLLNAGLELTEQLSSDELDTDTLDDVLLAT